jgi:tetratricopeptide (TPR) repeat protein
MPKQNLKYYQRSHIGGVAQHLHGLGVALLQKKKYAEAAEQLLRTVQANPKDPAALSLWGLALSGANRFDEALSAFDAALAKKSEDWQTHYNRANTLMALGRLREAVEAQDAALCLKPSFAEAACNRGNALDGLGRVAEALASYDQALAIKPHLSEALFNRAILLERTHGPSEALEAFERALSAEPKWAAGLIKRGEILSRLGRWEEALESLSRGSRLDPANEIALILRGDALKELGRFEEAAKCFRDASRIKPDYADAYDRLGLVLVDIGRFDEARRAHQQAVRLAPAKPGFYYNLLEVAASSDRDAISRSLLQLETDRNSLSINDQMILRFALGKSFKSHGDYRTAFQHFRKGNALKRAQTAYDEKATLADLENIVRLFTAKRLANHAGGGNPSDAPIFIVGMPRSGSTLIEQILASHPDVAAAGETRAFEEAAIEIGGPGLGALLDHLDDDEEFQRQIRRLGDVYLQRLARFGRARRVVNKMPDNFRMAGLIRLALPNAKIIHSKRNPIDTCVSCYESLFTETIPYVYDLSELGRYYQRYSMLMDHWRSTLPADVFLEVTYEDLIADSETQMRRIVEHCGLSWHPRCLEFYKNPRPIRTASAIQVRRPLYTDAIKRWAPIGAELGPLVAALGRSAPGDWPMNENRRAESGLVRKATKLFKQLLGAA